MLWLFAVTMGAVHAWAAISNYSMNEDGISYLDIGDAYMRGDWETALNSFWSPMYSWILGVMMALVKPSMELEFPLVHLVNFIIYVTALASFSFFWRQVTLYRNMRLGLEGGHSAINLPSWAWLTTGYLLFITVSLTMIELWAVTPDMLMSAFVYLAAGFLVRARMRPERWSNFALMGLSLGLGYLAKAIMFPVAILFLGVGTLTGKSIRRNFSRIALTGIVFLLVSAPFVMAVSWKERRLTIGGAGVLTYAKHVNGIQYPHWQGDGQNGKPIHPSRQILDEPPVYEFGTPIGGTYPIGYDPSHWYEGLELPFNASKQIHYLLISAQYFHDVFFRQFGGLTFAVILLYMLSRRWPSRITEFVSHWGLALIALAVIAFYGTVNVIGRYIGVFVALFFADLLANIRLKDDPWRRKLVPLLSAVIVIFMLMNLLAFNLSGIREMDLAGAAGRSQIHTVRTPSWPGEVAETLHELGVAPGDKVAVIGYGFGSFWARLARVRIVAEILAADAEPFWRDDADVQGQVTDAFVRAGAEAIIAENVPSYASLPGWYQVADTNYYVYLLTP